MPIFFSHYANTPLWLPAAIIPSLGTLHPPPHSWWGGRRAAPTLQPHPPLHPMSPLTSHTPAEQSPSVPQACQHLVASHHHALLPVPRQCQGAGMDQSFLSSSRAAPNSATVTVAGRDHVGCVFPSATPGSLETPHCLRLLQVSHMLRFAQAALHCLAASLFPIVPLLH